MHYIIDKHTTLLQSLEQYCFHAKGIGRAPPISYLGMIHYNQTPPTYHDTQFGGNNGLLLLHKEQQQRNEPRETPRVICLPTHNQHTHDSITSDTSLLAWLPIPPPPTHTLSLHLPRYVVMNLLLS